MVLSVPDCSESVRLVLSGSEFSPERIMPATLK